MKLVALIPAHNEKTTIGNAITGLQQQHRPPDQIVVVADNCIDNTADIARSRGVDVFTTQGNTAMKAGALNLALDWLIPQLHDRDHVLVQDADTILNTGFTRTALGRLRGYRIGAVGGIFYGEQGGGVLGLLQRMEYARYARETHRKKGRATVLTGTATCFPVRTLREVREARRSHMIGGGASYYSTASLTEDDEMTKAVKTLGYKPASPRGCEVETEIMPTVRKLWAQRLRWQRGALENLRDYGLTRVTAPYIAKQAAMGLGALLFMLYLVLTGIGLSRGGMSLSPFWLGIGGIFFTERIVSVRGQGWRAYALAACIIPDMLYDLFISAIYVKSIYDSLWRKAEQWAST
ncbi:glycosyltransferase family 2 protein [Streptacidiphilus sp. EB129]|jgi:biofilm PGA synthesis N-glycosyltransferase PgaC|uniref:glycosyltransferase family 2 protein n=1 Tax=Streptacidiphilus sp. EB129 TaxID=3156262 RepID=UPI003512487F